MVKALVIFEVLNVNHSSLMIYSKSFRAGIRYFYATLKSIFLSVTSDIQTWTKLDLCV